MSAAHEAKAKRQVSEKSARVTTSGQWRHIQVCQNSSLPNLASFCRPHTAIVYEDGHLYPHQNLYYITSAVWDLNALGAVLRSGIARLFISIYSTKMRGGYLRFQAQYLRRITLPPWQDVPKAIKSALIEAAEADDQFACNRAVFRLYGLSDQEKAALGGNGE